MPHAHIGEVNGVNVGQLVAAMAGAGLLTVAAIPVLLLRLTQRRSERDRRVADAADAVLAGVETFRQQGVTKELPQAAEVVHAKGHLRLIRPRATRRLSVGVCHGRPPEVEAFDDALVRAIRRRGQDV